MKIWEWANGRWPQIISALVGEQYINTRKHGPCPRGEGTDRFRFSDQGRGAYFCQCSDGKKGGIDMLQCVHGWDFKMTCQKIEDVIGKTPKDDEPVRRGPTYAQKLRAGIKPQTRSRYLESRKLEMPPGLHWHHAVEYFDADGNPSGIYPAMLAPIMRGTEFLTYHVTYLQNGKKAPVDKPRKILPGSSNIGGSCPLYPAAECMGIAEGVETAIAAKMLHGVPVWAALNTALMKSWEPPAVAKQVWIFGDSDKNFAGHSAAYALAHRLVGKGLEVQVVFPSKVDTDFADMLLEMEKAA